MNPGAFRACFLPLNGVSTDSQLAALSSLRMYVPKDLRQLEPRAAAVSQLAEVLRRFPNGPPVRLAAFNQTTKCSRMAINKIGQRVFACPSMQLMSHRQLWKT